MDGWSYMSVPFRYFRWYFGYDDRMSAWGPARSRSVYLQFASRSWCRRVGATVGGHAPGPVPGGSAQPAGDVPLCLGLLRAFEDLLGVAVLDEVPVVEEHRVLRHPPGLAQV